MADDVQVRENPGESRYEIFVGGQRAGLTQYSLHGNQADFTHTEIGEEYGGRGLASQLIHQALDDARTRGWQVMPYCRFVRGFIEKNPEYLDLVPTQHRGRFGLEAPLRES